jgi:hypothetical protein
MEFREMTKDLIVLIDKSGVFQRFHEFPMYTPHDEIAVPTSCEEAVHPWDTDNVTMD